MPDTVGNQKDWGENEDNLKRSKVCTPKNHPLEKKKPPVSAISQSKGEMSRKKRSREEEEEKTNNL
jgi:hypothetical protein